jgi:hypothetical protein
LKLIKQYFKGWGFNLQGKLRKKRASISDELSKLETNEELHGLEDHQYAQKVSLIKQDMSLIEQEEAYWLNRCHEQWLLKGDNNTSYMLLVLVILRSCQPKLRAIGVDVLHASHI